jgi:hypothetical protein
VEGRPSHRTHRRVVLFSTIYTFMAVTDYATWSVVALGVFSVVFLDVLAYTPRGERWHD